jgi:putative DNA primase/helicase
MTDARAIAKALGGKWAGRYGLARCPVHSDKTPSLKVTDDPRKDDLIDVYCFGGCDWRDVKAALVSQRLLPEFNPKQAQPHVYKMAPRCTEHEPEDEAARIELALKIWDAAGSLKGSLGFKYFIERRGLHAGLLDLDHCLRFHVGFGAVVVLMTDAITNQPVGVHRTFLKADATKNTDQGQKGKKMLGKQGVIRLSPEEIVTHGLGITEGIEDALAVLISGWSPVWAATSAGAIKTFPVLPGIEALTIFQDDNAAGSDAAEACAQRWHDAGREVFLASLKEQI